MNVYQAIRSRVAVREFKPDAVPEAIVRKLLLAARWAPSQRNRQPWHFIVIRDTNMLKQIGALAPTGPYIAQAPMAIAVVIDEDRPGMRFDAARAMENMELVAWAEGLGTCYVGQMDRDKIKEVLSIPREMELVTVMPFGYPTEKALKAGKRRKALSEIAHRERLGQKYE